MPCLRMRFALDSAVAGFYFVCVFVDVVWLCHYWGFIIQSKAIVFTNALPQCVYEDGDSSSKPRSVYSTGIGSSFRLENSLLTIRNRFSSGEIYKWENIHAKSSSLKFLANKFLV